MTEVHEDLARRIAQLQDTKNTPAESKLQPSTENTEHLTEIRNSLSKLVVMANTIPRQNILLKKLYFESMHQREDSVEDPQAGSFRWMLGLGDEEDHIRLDSEALRRIDRFNSSGSLSSIGTEDGSNYASLDVKQDSMVMTEHSGDGIINGTNDLSIQNKVDDQISMGSARAGHRYSSGEDDIESTSGSYEMSHASFDEEEVERRRQTSESFMSFLRNDHGVFFICGKAGSGKSTLSKFLARHHRVREELETWAGVKKLVFISTFFWNSGDTMQISLEGFYRSILYKTLIECPDLLQYIFPNLSDRHHHSAGTLGLMDSNTPFRISELKLAFQNLTRARSLPNNYRFCFFIDGLDEYAGDSLDHLALAKSLKEIAECENFKVLCFARPHTEFLDTFKNDRGPMYLHEFTQGDMYRFARLNILSIIRNKELDVEKEKYLPFAHRIVEMADGVFLWTRLVVRSLVSGIAHLDSLKDLQERLETTPKDLNGLLRKMLEGVEPAVRTRSNKLLLIAIHNPFPRPLNALAYSWLNELEDPEFPLNQPFEGYPEEEVIRRISIVRHQLDILTKGLLEIRRAPRRTFYQPQPSQYFDNCVEFLHRSVKDYLEHEWDYNNFSVPQSKMVQFETYCRLRLAEAKFSRSMDNYGRGFFERIHPIYNAIFEYFEACDQPLPPTYFNELGRVMDSFGHLLFSQMKTDQFASCFKLWAEHKFILPDSSESVAAPITTNTSHLHMASSYRITNAVDLFSQQDDLRKIDNEEVNILLTASTSTSPDLVEFLLNSGSSPTKLVKIESLSNKKPSDINLMEETVKVPVWAIFLRLMAIYHLQPFPSTRDRSRNALRDFPLILELYLRFGLDRDVYFIGYLDLPSSQNLTECPTAPRPIDTFSTEEPPPPPLLLVSENPPEDSLFRFELYQLVQLYQPKNIDSLEKLIVGDIKHQAWNKTASLLTGLAPWISPPTSKGPKLRSVSLEELNHKQWIPYGVVSKDHQLLGSFKYRLY